MSSRKKRIDRYKYRRRNRLTPVQVRVLTREEGTIPEPLPRRAEAGEDAMAARCMAMEDVIWKLRSLWRDANDRHECDPEEEVWEEDAMALSAAIEILSALEQEGICDGAAALDLLYDYNLARSALCRREKGGRK